MEIEKDTIKQALHTIIETYGTEILNDSRRTNAILMDFAPKQSRERKLIILALEEGIGNDLLKAQGKSDCDLQLCIKRCVRCLIDECWLAEEAAQFAVDTIVYALGIGSNEVSQSSINTLQPEYKNTTKLTNCNEAPCPLKVSLQPDSDNAVEFTKGTIIPDGVGFAELLSHYQEIGYKAFASDQTLKQLIIPHSIKKIKSEAFLNCTNLKYVILPCDIEEIGTGVFDGCDNLEWICFSDDKGFLWDEQGFGYYVSNGAVEDPYKEDDLQIKNTNILKGSVPECNKIAEFTKGTSIPNGADLTEILSQYQEIGYGAFASDYTLKELFIPDSIKKIKPKAFSNCVNLKYIVLPYMDIEVCRDAFDGCDALEAILFSSGFSSKTKYSFHDGMLIDYNRRALMRVTKSAGSTVKHTTDSIDARAFEKSEVQKVVLSEYLSTLPIDAFVSCDKLENIYIDHRNQSYTSIKGVLHSKDRTKLVRFPSGYQGVDYIIEDTVTHITDGAFCGTANIETITFTSNLKSIGSRAFEYCRKLSSLVLPSSVEIIGDRAFRYCDNLSSIMLHSNIQEVGDYAFCGCTSIQTIIIPEGVKRIGHAAFKDCSSLRMIIMQDNIEFIGDGAFVGCADDIEIAIKNNSYVEQYCSAHKITWRAL